jgi:hypothetical protein
MQRYLVRDWLAAIDINKTRECPLRRGHTHTRGDAYAVMASQVLQWVYHAAQLQRSRPSFSP